LEIIYLNNKYKNVDIYFLGSFSVPHFIKKHTYSRIMFGDDSKFNEKLSEIDNVYFFQKAMGHSHWKFDPYGEINSLD
jgi:hypothetical protein